MDAVHTKRAVAASFEELYRCVEDMCLHKMAPGLFQNLHALCDAHVAGAYTRPLFSST